MSAVAAWCVLFVAIAGIYAATFSFRNITDTDLNSFQTRALALHGDIDLTRYRASLPERSKSAEHEGKLYSTYGLGISVSAFPIYAVLARLEVSERALQAAASIPFVAASAVILFRLFLRLFSRAIATGATVIYAFGTTMWPVAAMGFFQTGPASLFQAVGLTGLFSSSRRAPALAGLGFAAAAFVRPTLFIPLLVVGLLYVIEDRGRAMVYAAGAAPVVGAVLFENRWIWGSWLSGGYGNHGVGFHADMPSAFYGLLFGWWRGLFVYSPVLILGVLGSVLVFRRLKGFVERRLVALSVSTLAIVLLYSKWSVWYGGTAQFGYRLLLDVVPFLVLLSAYAVVHSERVRLVGLALGAVSVLTMAAGAAPNIYGWDTGALHPQSVDQTSFGQAWIEFVHRPSGSVLRLIGVAAVGLLLYILAPSKSTVPFDHRKGGISHPEVSAT